MASWFMRAWDARRDLGATLPLVSANPPPLEGLLFPEVDLVSFSPVLAALGPLVFQF